MRGSRLGEFEELVLMAVAALDGQGYGLTVQQLLDREAGRTASLGAIHATLYRLEDKGLLESDMQGATEERGGRRKRMFRVTGLALQAMREAQEARESLLARMPDALRPGVSS